MQQGSNLEIPLRIIGPGGTTSPTVLWEGSGWLGTAQTGKAASTIGANTELNLVAASLVIQAADLPATAVAVANVLSVQQAPVTPSMVVGVALNAGVANDIIAIAGNGSIVPVQTTAVTQVVGQHTRAAANGQLAVSNAAAEANPAQSLGFIVKNRGTTGGATDTGTNTQAAVLVNIHGA